MTHTKTPALIIVGLAAVLGLYMWERTRGGNVEGAYEKEITEFRKAREARLRSDDGWLTVVGLTWLKEGANAAGSAKDASVQLPLAFPGALGEITLTGREAKLTVRDTSGVLIDGTAPKAGETYTLKTDAAEQQPTVVTAGTAKFFLIDRKNGVGVRMKDSAADAVAEFAGNDWYPPRKEFIIEGTWEENPKKIFVPDVIGNMNEEDSPGIAKFQVDGETVQLRPTIENDELFFVFRDGTSGTETYGAARFLYAKKPTNGHLTLDFNKAINPPCAFTKFATCPMPPAENVLKVAIRAGELKPLNHAE